MQKALAWAVMVIMYSVILGFIGWGCWKLAQPNPRWHNYYIEEVQDVNE